MQFLRPLLCSIILSLCTNGLAATTVPDAEAAAPKKNRANRALDSFLVDNKQKHYWFGYFEVSGFGAFQPQGGGYTLSPHVAWKPTVVFTDWLALRGSLGITELKNTNPTDRLFLVTEYQLMAAFGIDEGIFELGGGAQNWAQNGGTKVLISAVIGVPMANEWLGFIDRFIIGYSVYLSTPRITNEVRIGAGVAF